MRAITCTKYGHPDVLKLIEVKKPIPKDDEVLIKIHASSINSYDWRIMRGKPFMVRLAGLLKSRKNKILGCDVAGKIEAVGKSNRKFKVGDEIYGCLADNSGDSTYAEYVCAKENILAIKPLEISFEQAASVPMAAVTALQGLRDVGNIKTGQKVLINGASGGVGTFAVQIAKAYGAEVTGVCSKRNIEIVRSIGADYVIDYTTEDFAKNGKQYDLILDVAANYSLSDYRHSLNPNGICVVAGFSKLSHTLKVGVFGKRTAKKDGKKIVLLLADNRKSDDLIFMNELLKSGKVVPVIDDVYSLHEVRKAFTYFENEHAQGKVVLRMD